MDRSFTLGQGHSLAHAKVHELHNVEVLAQDQVGRLHVPMDDHRVPTVQKVEGPEQVKAPAEDRPARKAISSSEL